MVEAIASSLSLAEQWRRATAGALQAAIFDIAKTSLNCAEPRCGATDDFCQQLCAEPKGRATAGALQEAILLFPEKTSLICASLSICAEP